MIVEFIIKNALPIGAGLTVAVVLITAFFLLRRKKPSASSCNEVLTMQLSKSSGRYRSKALTLNPFEAQIIGTRKDQQDTCFFQLLQEPEGSVLFSILCDGMGGLANGSEASMICVQSMAESFSLTQGKIKDYSAFYKSALRLADQKVSEAAQKHSEGARSGTTMVSAIVKEDRLYWASVGDSRIYLFREGELHQLTRDHNYALSLAHDVKSGRITQRQAESDPEKEALISFVGMNGIELVDVADTGTVLRAGDIVLLCSDGLYKALKPQEISELLAQYSREPRFLAGVLTAAAFDKDLKHQDNTSVIVLCCREQQQSK